MSDRQAVRDRKIQALAMGLHKISQEVYEDYVYGKWEGFWERWGLTPPDAPLKSAAMFEEEIEKLGSIICWAYLIFLDHGYHSDAGDIEKLKNAMLSIMKERRWYPIEPDELEPLT